MPMLLGKEELEVLFCLVGVFGIVDPSQAIGYAVDMCIDADAGSKAFSDAEVEGGDFGSHS
jgi:hypothetical protein